jgi:hypothetical protein
MGPMRLPVDFNVERRLLTWTLQKTFTSNDNCVSVYLSLEVHVFWRMQKRSHIILLFIIIIFCVFFFNSLFKHLFFKTN